VPRTPEQARVPRVPTFANLPWSTPIRRAACCVIPKVVPVQDEPFTPDFRHRERFACRKGAANVESPYAPSTISYYRVAFTRVEACF
jgi:hypothetical protein